VMSFIRVLKLLFVLLLAAPNVVLAVECSEIFPEGQRTNPNLAAGGNTLELAGRTSPGEPWPATGGQPLQAGEYIFNGRTLTDYRLEVAPGAEVTIFVDGDLTLGEDVRINRAGEANQLLIVVDGDFSATPNSNAANKRVEVNGFIYAAGTITLANNNIFQGSLAAGGTVNTGNNTVATPANWLDERRLRGLCEIPELGGLPVFDNFESYVPGASIDGSNGGSGWGGPWSGRAGQSLVDTSDNPLEFVDSEGRRIRSATTLEIVGNDNEVASRPLNGTFSSDTLFLSMLVRFTGDPSNNDFVGFWIERPTFGDSPQFGLKVNEGGSGSDDFFVRLDQNADYATNLETGRTYLLVAQYSKTSENFFNTARLWVNPECEATPPATPSAQQSLSPSNRVSEVSTVGFRAANLSGSDAFEIGQVAVGTRWTEVVNCSPGPLVEYRLEQTGLDGTAGEIRDTSGNNNDATSLGGLGTAIDDPVIAGNPGTCRYGDFDGNNDQITDRNAGDYLNGLEAVTVMAWVYNTAALDGNDRGLFFTDDTGSGRDNRLGLRYDTSGFFGGANNVIKASVFTDECNRNQECLQVETASNTMAINQWQHLAMTWTTDGEIKVYINGAEVATSGTQGNGGTGALAGVDRLDIGQGAKGQRWQGRIDEFKVFGVALTEAEIAAEKDRVFPCEAVGLNHIRLTHPGEGLTCSPADITVTACANADCSARFSDPVTVDFTSPAQNWSPDPVTFAGTTDVSLQYTTAETVTLNAVAISTTANNPTRCFDLGGAETCAMNFVDSGFILEVPDQISATATEGTIAAVSRGGANEPCVPGFANVNREVAFWSGYSDPDTGTEAVVMDSEAIDGAAPGTGIDLAFGADGVARFELVYPDAGRVALNARYQGSEANGDAGLTLTGTDDFIARPARFRLDVPDNPGAADAEGDVFRTAGEVFEMTVSTLNANDQRTPNFGRESVPESVRLETSLVAPTTGRNPALSGAFGTFGQACDGSSADRGTACGEFNWPEVGIISLRPRLESATGYLGSADVVGDRLDRLGRFIPARFDLQITETGEVEPFCTLGGVDFAYSGQALGWRTGFEPRITATARNTGGGTTENYTEGAFLKLENTDLARTAGIADNDTVNADDNLYPVTASLGLMTLTNLGAGQVAYTFAVNDTLIFDKTVASRVAPFTPDYTIALTALEDADDVTAAPQTPVELNPVFGFQLRYGRLALENAYGPETEDLVVPFRVDYYTGSDFALNEPDSCWTYNTATEVSLDQTGLSGGSTSVVAAADNLALGRPPAGSELVLSAPLAGNTGDVGVTFTVPDWLQGDYDDEGTLENPSALATFGVYRGNDRIIYWRER